MKFTLVYDGPLPPNGTPEDKWVIRKYLSQQLEELWQIHPSLQDTVRRRFLPRDRPFKSPIYIISQMTSDLLLESLLRGIWIYVNILTAEAGDSGHWFARRML